MNVVEIAPLTAGSPVPLTVNVYVPEEVPFPEFPDGACQKSPQPVIAPRAVISRKAPSIERQLRRREGIPRKTRKARTAPPLAPIHPRPLL